MWRSHSQDFAAAIQIFYKNLTVSWHLPIPFPLDHHHAATGSEEGGCLLPCRTLQKYRETIQLRSCSDDRRNYGRSNPEYSMERSAGERALPISREAGNSF